MMIISTKKFSELKKGDIVVLNIDKDCKEISIKKNGYKLINK